MIVNGMDICVNVLVATVLLPRSSNEVLVVSEECYNSLNIKPSKH